MSLTIEVSALGELGKFDVFIGIGPWFYQYLPYNVLIWLNTFHFAAVFFQWFWLWYLSVRLLGLGTG